MEFKSAFLLVAWIEFFRPPRSNMLLAIVAIVQFYFGSTKNPLSNRIEKWGYFVVLTKSEGEKCDITVSYKMCGEHTLDVGDSVDSYENA